jgi:carbamoyl-phosphate synthase large subunit
VSIEVESVLIAGIGGASLGTEVLKSLTAAKRYAVYGCDISPYAFGHYQEGFERTFVAPEDGYLEFVKSLCVRCGIRVVIPGGEAPLRLLGPAAPDFALSGIHIAANSAEVISTCSDKGRLFERLRDLGIPIPQTIQVRSSSDLHGFSCPCIIKPATDSGGSNLVFLAADISEAELYASYLLRAGKMVLAQEYIPLDAGEFTIGVLSFPNRQLVGSVAMRRFLDTKLSVLAKTLVGLVSTGYSQGLIDEFADIRRQAEAIAVSLGSSGPLNIQGRVRDGVLLPFEINARFSASTYLRTLAGLNEIDMYLQNVLHGLQPTLPQIRTGYYFRSLSETFVPRSGLRR